MSSESKSVPPLCVGGCGFYGALETRNMCSSCYNDFLKGQIQKASAGMAELSITGNRVSESAVAGSADVIEPPPPPATAAATAATAAATAAAATAAAATATAAAVKKRCEGCNKKLGLLGFTCRCGKVFCGQHRYPKEHSCSFDFKTRDRMILAKQNPVVMGEKLDLGFKE